MMTRFNRVRERLGDTLRCAVPVLLALLATSCAEERPAINRVQPYALAKSFFVGEDLRGFQDDPEFYKRGTIVDVDYGAGVGRLFTSTSSSPVSRIRWEITESTLNARLTYERLPGSEKPGASSAVRPTANGQIVASYAILSHFDITRDYNPGTGEELNVVNENVDDRPWYDRKHFRVDWSKNLITTAYDYDTLAQSGIYGGITYEAFAYTLLDPAHPDAPHFEVENGYFDITNKAYATPELVDLSALGGPKAYPACELSSRFAAGTYPWGNCNPTEITLRESFRKVTDTDYEPMHLDGERFKAFGAFNFDYRRGYDRRYGLLDDEWFRFVSRYNIWELSHYYADPEKRAAPIACATKETTEDATSDPYADPNRDLEPRDGTADECQAAGAGSRCDVFTHRCTLPYGQRKVKTIAWYVAGDTSLFEPTNWAVLEWDIALKTAVQTARLAECARTGGSNCETRYPMWQGQQEDNDEAVRIAREVDLCRRTQGFDAGQCDDLARNLARKLAAERGNESDAGTLAIGEISAMQPVLVLCHNPVTAEDHPSCGKPGLTARQGDIRYNLVLAVERPQDPSPWGIMADGSDPLTGEKVVGSMNIWTDTTDAVAQQIVDLVRYVSGEIPTDQITNGQYVRNWASAARLSAGSSLPLMGASEVNERLASTAHVDRETFEAINATPASAQEQRALDAENMLPELVADANLPSAQDARLRLAFEQAQGTDVESALLNPAMFQLAGIASNASPETSALDAVSPLRMNNPGFWEKLAHLRGIAHAERGACVIDEAPEPSAITGLGDILLKKFPRAEGETAAQTKQRYERMFKYLQRHLHYGIIAHEMGHSVGLRHNFVSSAASLFYRPQYWQLRTKNGKVTQACADAVDSGDNCVGPRYWDPITDEEQSQLLWMWMHSSSMDYPGDVSQDLLGIGPTDFAATRFFYGDVVSMYRDPAYSAGSPIGAGIAAATDSFGGGRGVRYGMRGTRAGITYFHYSQLQNNYGVIKDCYATTPEPPASWNQDLDGAWDPVLDGRIVSVDGAFTKCRQQPVDYMFYGDLRPPSTEELNGAGSRAGRSVDATTGRQRVPYPYATDHWVDIGNTSVFRHDSGADPYEQVQYLISTRENRLILDDYRRGRSTFSVRSAAERSFVRYAAKLLRIGTSIAPSASSNREFAQNQGLAFDTWWPRVVRANMADNMLAATVAFDEFVRMLSRPQPGEHYQRNPAFGDAVFRSLSDPDDSGPDNTGLALRLFIPAGSTGFLRDVGFGGHPLENGLLREHGDYATEYVANAGSYYDKIQTAILFAESEDRFVSESRRDFYDARFRAAGMADILPDGFRRVIANALTGDRSLFAPRVVADASGAPLLDDAADTTHDPNAKFYPKHPLGWTSFWPVSGPVPCFASHGRNACLNSFGTGTLAPADVSNSVSVDPQIGWEVQKFLIAWTIPHIKANERTEWLDMLRLYRIGKDANPEFETRIEWQDPTSGEVYYARDYGTECLFGDARNACAGGKIVQKGIAARVLEYANTLTARAYQLNETDNPAQSRYPAGFNQFGRAVVRRHPDGTPIVKADPAVRTYSDAGQAVTPQDCDQNAVPTCRKLSIYDNHWAGELQAYKSVPDFLWQASKAYGLFDRPTKLGTR